MHLTVCGSVWATLLVSLTRGAVRAKVVEDTEGAVSDEAIEAEGDGGDDKLPLPMVMAAEAGGSLSSQASTSESESSGPSSPSLGPSEEG